MRWKFCVSLGVCPAMAFLLFKEIILVLLNRSGCLGEFPIKKIISE
jgi:hypothetical protein